MRVLVIVCALLSAFPLSPFTIHPDINTSLGVPQLVLPMSYDQTFWADRVSTLGVGAALPWAAVLPDTMADSDDEDTAVEAPDGGGTLADADAAHQPPNSSCDTAALVVRRLLRALRWVLAEPCSDRAASAAADSMIAGDDEAIARACDLILRHVNDCKQIEPICREADFAHGSHGIRP